MGIYRATLLPILPSISLHIEERGPGIFYLPANMQERLLEYRRVSAARLLEYATQARNAVQFPLDADVPPLATLIPVPATNTEEEELNRELSLRD